MTKSPLVLVAMLFLILSFLGGCASKPFAPASVPPADAGKTFMLFPVSDVDADLDGESVSNLTGPELDFETATIIEAKAGWLFTIDGQQSIHTYVGYGPNKDAALYAARQKCVGSQTIDDWVHFCKQTPAEVEYKDVTFCESRRTGWKDIGSSIGNPCDRGCRRGQQLNEEFRRNPNFPFQPQHRIKFRCVRG